MKNAPNSLQSPACLPENNACDLRDSCLNILAVFLASVCVMVIELVAGRLMSRYIGQSLYTWTAVIGLVLSGITLGNVLGGRLADRYRANALFAVIFLFASVTAMLIPLLNHLAGNGAWLLNCETRLRIFLHVGVTFLIPSVALGMVGPVAAKRAVESHQGVGRALGNVYAWSAAGSIVGTFLTGYYLIAAIGTAVTLILAAALLFGLGLLFSAFAWRSRVRAVALGAGLPFAMLALSSMATPTWWMPALTSADNGPAKTLFAKESPYALVSVMAREDLPRFRQLYLDRLPHSEVDATQATNLLAGYTWLMQGALEARFGTTQAVSILVIGGGGYALPRQAQASRPGSRIVVAEIDPVVTEAAIAACGLSVTNGMEIHHADGRQVVQALVRAGSGSGGPPAPAAKFDCVVGDTVEYYSLPYHLATREFAEEVATVLKPDGIYLLHIVTDRKLGAAYLGAILNTLEQVFPQVSVVALKSNPDLYSSHLLIASRIEAQTDRIIPCIQAAHPGFYGEKLTALRVKQLKSEAAGMVLTDDHAPLEQLVEPVVRGDRREPVRFRVNRSRLALGTGQLDLAETEARLAVQADDGSAEGHFALALVLQQRSRWAQALAEVSRVLAIDPEIFPAQVIKGRLLAASGEVAKACEEWRAVLVLRPKNLDALQGLAYAREYQDEPVEAVKAWEGILALQPDDPTAHYALARLFKRAGQAEASARHLAECRRVDPEMKKVQPNPMPMKSIAQAFENLSL
jgi:tetratricopeptide (TPR) repeat protein/MFS family permease